MNAISDLLGGIGLFLCVGAAILAVVIALAVRAFSSNRDRDARRDVIDERGREVPTYDSRRVESSGGFGTESNIPQTGTTTDVSRDRARVYDPDSPERDFGDVSDVDDRMRDRDESGRTLPDLDDDAETRRRNRPDDDDVRSSGGFGS